MSPLRRRSAVLAVALLIAAACGDDGGAAACTELREPPDPASFHVIGAGEDVAYLTSPPTSGPHVNGVRPTDGIVDNPLVEPLQVAILEDGSVLVQHEGLSAEDRAALEALATDGLVVAPGVDLPAPIVATAWTWKLTCESLDEPALETFTARADDAPGRD